MGEICTVVFGMVGTVRHHRCQYVCIATGLRLWEAWMEWIIAGVLEEKLDTLQTSSLVEVINMLMSWSAHNNLRHHEHQFGENVEFKCRNVVREVHLILC